MDRNNPSSCEGQIKVRMAGSGPRTLPYSPTLGSSHHHPEADRQAAEEGPERDSTQPDVTQPDEGSSRSTWTTQFTGKQQCKGSWGGICETDPRGKAGWERGTDLNDSNTGTHAQKDAEVLLQPCLRLLHAALWKDSRQPLRTAAAGLPRTVS